MKRYLYVLLIIVLINFCNSHDLYALHRDYFYFYRSSQDGCLYYGGPKLLDDTASDWSRYDLEWCADHFTYQQRNPNCEQYFYEPLFHSSIGGFDLLHLLPQLQVVNEKIGTEFICTYSNCKGPVHYPGYLDTSFHIYNPLLEEQLLHVRDAPSCVCFWPECSNAAAQVNDHAYLLFRKLFTSSALSTLVYDGELQEIFFNISRPLQFNLHGMTVSCVARALWFSHYYRICINLLEFLSSDPSVKLLYPKAANQENQQLVSTEISQLLRRLAEMYVPIYVRCLEMHRTAEIEQELHFILGLYPALWHETNLDILKNQSIDCLTKQKDYCVLANSKFCNKQTIPVNSFLSEFYLLQGLFNNDVLQFDKAITLLTASLDFDSQNKMAYLARAYAHFELLNFEEAILDFKQAKLLSVKPPLLQHVEHHTIKSHDSIVPKNLTKYTQGFIYGFMNGINEGSRTFVPSVLHTVTGVSQGLWYIGTHPKQFSYEFITAIEAYISLLREYATPELLNTAIPEIDKLLGQWAGLPDQEKGQHVGYVVGKFGIDILLCQKSVDLVHKFRELKYANSAITLEACEFSEQRQLIIDEAKNRRKFRTTLLQDQKIKIHWDKQNKHIPGSHNYEPGKSTITVKRQKLEELVKKYAGTGQAIRGKLGEAGYKEFVDFEIEIGKWIDCTKPNMDIVELPTSKGTIHYDRNGFLHVIPAYPYNTY